MRALLKIDPGELKDKNKKIVIRINDLLSGNISISTFLENLEVFEPEIFGIPEKKRQEQEQFRRRREEKERNQKEKEREKALKEEEERKAREEQIEKERRDIEAREKAIKEARRLELEKEEKERLHKEEEEKKNRERKTQKEAEIQKAKHEEERVKKQTNKNTLIVLGVMSILLLGYWMITSETGDTSLKTNNIPVPNRIKEQGSILWGADAEGGARYIFPDPENPEKYIGFEVDLAEAIANKLGVKAIHKQNTWDGLIPALERGDFDIAMNGLYITDNRKDKIIFSRPYYICVEQLVVRKEETNIEDINDLKGKKVGTLSGTLSQDILQNIGGADVRIYPGQVAPYEDLVIGRIDAVLLDLPIAAFYGKPNPELKYAGKPMGEELYGIAIRKEDEELKVKIDEILADLLRSGELKRIYEKWDLWNEAQNKLYERMQTV